MNTLIQELIKNESGQETYSTVDVYHTLANNRMLFLCNYVDDKSATDIVACLLSLNIDSEKDPITIFLNSEGGDIRNIFMICDTISHISAPVQTVCIGSAMNESVLLLAAGTKGMRSATKNAIICVNSLVHEDISFSDLTDAKNNLEQLTDDNKKMMSFFASKTGKTLKQVSKDFERKTFMNAKQAVKYNLIDKVLNGR